MTNIIRNGHRETCPASRGGMARCNCDYPAGARPVPRNPQPATRVALTADAEQIAAALAALSEAVTHAQDQLPESQAQVWRDAERLVWEALGAL